MPGCSSRHLCDVVPRIVYYHTFVDLFPVCRYCAVPVISPHQPPDGCRTAAHSILHATRDLSIRATSLLIPCVLRCADVTVAQQATGSSTSESSAGLTDGFRPGSNGTCTVRQAVRPIRSRASSSRIRIRVQSPATLEQFSEQPTAVKLGRSSRAERRQISGRHPTSSMQTSEVSLATAERFFARQTAARRGRSRRAASRTTFEAYRS